MFLRISILHPTPNRHTHTHKHTMEKAKFEEVDDRMEWREMKEITVYFIDE